MKPRFFATPLQFHNWLSRNRDSEKEILVGFHKKTSGKKSITYSEALDEALCFGWIDGVRKSLNDDSYTIRFTPRRARSIWSLVNVRHIERLQKEGRMQPSGVAAFDARDPKRTGIYALKTDRASSQGNLKESFAQTSMHGSSSVLSHRFIRGPLHSG